MAELGEECLLLQLPDTLLELILFTGLECNILSGRDLANVARTCRRLGERDIKDGLSLVENVMRIKVKQWTSSLVQPLQDESWPLILDIIQRTRVANAELRQSSLTTVGRKALSHLLTGGELNQCPSNCQYRRNGLPCAFTHPEERCPYDEYNTIGQCVYQTISQLYRDTGGRVVRKVAARVLRMTRFFLYAGLYWHAEASLKVLLGQATRATPAQDIEAHSLLVDVIITSCYMSTYVSFGDEIRCTSALEKAHEAEEAIARLAIQRELHGDHEGLREVERLRAYNNYVKGRACALAAQHYCLFGSRSIDVVSDIFSQGRSVLEASVSYYSSHEQEYYAARSQAAIAELYYCIASAKTRAANLSPHMNTTQIIGTSLALFQQSIDLFMRIGESDSLGAATAQKDMGKTENFRSFYLRGLHEDGTPKLIKALSIYETLLGNSHPAVENVNRLLHI